MLGRGERSAPEKGKGPRKGGAAGKGGDEGGEGRPRTAAEQAAKAEEAAEAARLAEEAAERAREAARLAQIAADAAAAADEAEDTAEAAEDDESEAPAKAESVVKTAVKPRRTKKAPEVGPEDDEPAADVSAPAEAAAADVDEVETGTKPEIGDGAADTDTDDDTDSEEESEEDSEDGDAKAEADDEDDDAEDEDDAPKTKRGRRLSLKKAAKVEVDDDEDEDEDDEPGRRFGTGGFTLLAVLVVLVLAFGTASTLLFLKQHEQSATDDARKNGLWAASKAAQELSSYDYRTIDTDTKAAAAMTTGKLHDDYVKQIPSFKAQATAQQLIGTTTVMKTGAISASPDKVVALVYADRSSATKNDKTQQLPESLRLKMTMVKVHGKWLAERVDVIS
jgi:type II secretory pathway pseudopilin PulG